MRKTMWVVGCFLLVSLIALPIKETMEVYDPVTFPLTGTRIVLDAGHGGADGGAVKEGVSEKEITLKVVQMVRAFLEEAGAKVYVTRDEDKDLAHEDTKGLAKRKAEDIRERLAYIEEQEATLYLSIHLNALDDSRWYGAQTFYYPSQKANQQIAEKIQASFITNLANTKREALPIEHIYLLKHTKTPGALVEIGFLSNPEERKQLENSDYQRKVAASIYYGILDYITDCLQNESEESCDMYRKNTTL